MLEQVRVVMDFSLQFEATQTHYEYEIGVTANEGEFNSTNNISISQDRSGSIRSS